MGDPIVPAYRAPTIVGPVLSRTPSGHVVHWTVCTTALPGPVHLKYWVRHTLKR
jgi:hypothetical protein